MPYQLPRLPAKAALNGFGDFDYKKNGIPTQGNLYFIRKFPYIDRTKFINAL